MDGVRIVEFDALGGADSVGIDRVATVRQLERLYLEAFPPEERRPWPQIADGMTRRLHPFAILSDGAVVGLITVWTFDGFVYIEHFAVDRSLRSNGLGSKTISLVRKQFDASIVLEAEPPATSPMAQRRIGFYERNGFHVADKTYVQPPYAPGMPSVPLWLLADGAVDATSAALTIHREVYACI